MIRIVTSSKVWLRARHCPISTLASPVDAVELSISITIIILASLRQSPPTGKPANANLGSAQKTPDLLLAVIQSFSHSPIHTHTHTYTHTNFHQQSDISTIHLIDRSPSPPPPESSPSRLHRVHRRKKSGASTCRTHCAASCRRRVSTPAAQAAQQYASLPLGLGAPHKPRPARKDKCVPSSRAQPSYPKEDSARSLSSCKYLAQRGQTVRHRRGVSLDCLDRPPVTGIPSNSTL